LNTNFRIRSTLAAILLFVGLLSAGYAQADSANITSVSLDPTFSDDGWTTLDFFGRSDIVDSVLIQPDGRLILSGQVAVNTTSRDFGLARYNPDGTLDDTFGTGGMLNLDLGGREYTGVAVLQSDGKIVVGGEQSISGTDFIIARLNTDGSLDTTFGAPNGYVVTDLGGSDSIYGLAILPDGRIVAAGSSYSTDSDLAIARYNPNGSLDTTFAAPNGYQVIDLPNEQNGNNITLQADGAIVLAGSTDANGLMDFLLARINPDGGLDPTFGTGGLVTTDFSGGVDVALDLAQQPDGKLVAVGSATVGSASHIALARYNADGSLDETFGINGLVTTVAGNYPGAHAVAIQGGLITVAGECFVSDVDFVVARYDSTGSLDPNFGSGGLIISDLGTAYDGARDILIQPNGDVVVAGFTQPGTYYDFAIARYTTTFTTISRIFLPTLVKGTP